MMRCTYFLLTCCLLVSSFLLISQVQATGLMTGIIPGGVMAGSLEIEKEIEIEAKDIIVNVGKVDIEIEKNQRKEKYQNTIESADTEDADIETENYPPTPSTSIEKEIEIEAKDIIVNIGKVKVEIEKDDHHYPPHSTYKPTYKPTHKPTWKPTYKPTHKPTYKPTWKPYDDATDPIDSTDSVPSAEEEENIVSDNTTLPLFEDFIPAAEPSTDETVLGENATAAAITVQGGEHFDERGVLILTGPQIFSVTFKIIKEKVITIKGSNLKDDFGVNGIDDGFIDGIDGENRKRREAVTFIIRGRGFVPGRELFTDIENVVGSTSRGGMFDFLEPRVFLGAIPLKVVRFTDTTILARFLDFEDQRRFEAGTLLARVKVLHVEIREKKKKHGPEEDFGILGDEKQRNEIASVGGLVLPALGAIGGSITSGPVLGVIGVDGRDEHDHGNKQDDFGNSLLGLFSGLRFDTAVLSVMFSEKDAQRIRGSFNTLFTDDAGLGFPDI